MKLTILLFEAQGKDNKEQVELFFKFMDIDSFPDKSSDKYIKVVEHFMVFAKYYREEEEKLKDGKLPTLEDMEPYKKAIIHNDIHFKNNKIF